jgi:hypothetical protein
MTPSSLYLVMVEVFRRSAEPGAVNISDRENYQRQRSNNTNWLDWYALTKMHYDKLNGNHRMCIERVYNDGAKGLCSEIMRLADDGLQKWFTSLPAELVDQGENIHNQIW